MTERKQINFTIVPDDAGDSPRTYANFCAISHTPFDFTLSFCEVQPLSQRDIEAAEADHLVKAPVLGIARRRPRLRFMEQGLITHIDLDAFFVAVERARRPELSGRAVIIGGRPGSRGMVASASREARRHGVRVGMPLAQAAVRCPDAVFVDGAFDSYFAASLQVDEILRRESTEIEWLSIDEVVVALPTPRAAIAIVERIRSRIHALGFDASCGVARSKLVARLAAQLGRPRGLVHVLDGYEARFLAPLKIEMLPGIDPPLARRFRGVGIRRLGQLATLSEAQLTGIAGHAGAGLARRAAGIDPSRVRRTALPPPRLDDRDLTPPTADAAVVHAAIASEADRLGRDLRSRGVYARTVTLRVRFADGRVDSRTATLSEPSALDGVLLAGLLDLLPRMWAGGRLVRSIGASCAGLMAAAHDATLFGT
jgi:DNA polymerase-4